MGIHARAIVGERGVLDAAAVEAAIRPDDPHYARSRAIATNLLFVSFSGWRAASPRLGSATAGVLCNPEGSPPDLLRFVTHLDVSASDVEEAARRIAAVVGG